MDNEVDVVKAVAAGPFHGGSIPDSSGPHSLSILVDIVCGVLDLKIQVSRVR